MIEVIDPDPQARTRAVKVKVAAQVQPVIPAGPPGSPFTPVEFTGLTVTPYVNQAGRLAYSVKATGIRAPGRGRPGRDQGGGGMRSGGGSMAHVGVYVGEDWWTFLSTYEDHTPILDISCGSTTVSLSIADRKTGEAAVEFARELAGKAAKFAAEVERLHAQDHDGDGEA